MKMVLTSILEQVAADSTVQFPAAKGASTEEEHLVNIISNFLEDKRYLVVIDDLWHYGEWEVIKKSLPENKLGSRIITSTRMNDIAEKCHDDFDTLLYKMNPQREYRSKGWVYQIGSENVGARIIAAMSSDIVGEGFDRDHPVVRMCGGMPLAILCMLSAVAKERDKQAQQGVYAKTRDVQDTIVKQVIQNGIQNTPGFEPLVESLQLGYDDLPHHMLKTCLLYCTIYPENHEMKRDYLVRRWIAHGFVCGENAAKGYFDELVNRGLIQFLDGFHARLFRYGMHPMIRNFLGRKFREDSFITCSSEITASSYSCQIRRLSIDYWPSSDGAVLGIDWSRIRSLVVFGGAHRVPLEQLERLRVLDLECDEALENHHLKDICGLLRVRHLIGLQGMGISEIPPEIVRLQHLETLDVRKTGITELPREIGDLQQLRSLDVSNTQGLVELPKEVGDLQHLENLCLSKTNITELPREVAGRLKKLKTLDISENGKIRELSKEIIAALPHLEILDVSHTCITEIPSEVGSFQNLERLHLQSTKVTKIPREIGRLKKLKILELDERITTLPWEAGQLSQVEGLPECVRQVWKKTDLMSSLAGEILSFQKQPGSSGDGGLIVGTKHMHIPGWIKEQFNNIGYLDIRICKLEEGCLVTLREMPSLQILKLRFEVVPKKRVVFSGEGFAKLVVLHIDSRVPQVTFQEGAMPWLQFLKFEIQFYSGSPNTDPMGIKHLVSLREVSFICNDWYQVDSPFISVTIDAVRKELQEHPRNSPTCYRGRAYVHVNGLQLRPLSD